LSVQDAVPTRICPRKCCQSVVEDGAEGGGEGVRLAHAAEFAAEESVVAAGEDDWRRAQAFGDRHGGAAGQHLPGLLSDADDDAGRRRPERVEVVLVARAGRHVLPDERVGARAVVLSWQPERGGVGIWPVRVVGRDRTLLADDRDELRHRRAEAAALVGLLDVHAGRQRGPAVRQFYKGGRLVRHERAHLFRVRRREGERVDRAAAGGEDIDRPGRKRAQRGDQPVQVISVFVGRGLEGIVRALAASRRSGVIGHHRPVGEMPGQRDESGGAHRRSDEQQHRARTRFGGPDVVIQHGPRHGEGVGLLLGHR
jgi:hypothetical protein